MFDFLEGGRDRDWRPARVESDGIEKRFFASFSFLLRFCLRWKKGRRERFIFFLLGKDLNGVIRFGIVQWRNFVILNMMFLNDVSGIIGKDIGLLAFFESNVFERCF